MLIWGSQFRLIRVHDQFGPQIAMSMHDNLRLVWTRIVLQKQNSFARAICSEFALSSVMPSNLSIFPYNIYFSDCALFLCYTIILYYLLFYIYGIILIYQSNGTLFSIIAWFLISRSFCCISTIVLHHDLVLFQFYFFLYCFLVIDSVCSSVSRHLLLCWGLYALFLSCFRGSLKYFLYLSIIFFPSGSIHYFCVLYSETYLLLFFSYTYLSI